MSAPYEMIKAATTGTVVRPSTLPGTDGEVKTAAIQALKDGLVEVVFRHVDGGDWTKELAKEFKGVDPDKIHVGFRRLP